MPHVGINPEKSSSPIELTSTLTMQCKICQQGKLHQESGDFYDYLSNEQFQIWRCEHCSSLQTQGNTQGNYYGKAYYGSEKGKFSPFLEKIFTANHKRNARYFFNRFKPRTVVEIGCGRAYVLQAMQDLGCKVNGLESTSAADWILNNSEVPVHGVKDGDRWPLEDNSQDLVIIWHVLEHVTDPEMVLKEIRRVLSPTGTVCISVPNAGSLQAKLQLPQWFHLDVPRHLFHFTEFGLTQLLLSTGYIIRQKEPGDFTQNLYGWWQTLCNLLTPRSNNLLFRFIQGGIPWQSCKNKPGLLIQLAGLPIIIPLGMLGWLVEKVTDKPGSMTFYVQKTNNQE